MLKNVHVQWQSFIYPVIFAVMMLITASLLGKSLLFFQNTIRVLVVGPGDTAASKMSLRLSDYEKLTGKLRLEVAHATSVTPSLVVTSTPLSAEDNEVQRAEEIDRAKMRLSIAVYNSTSVSGLALKLKTALEKGGFVVEKIGTLSGLYDGTIVRIKDSQNNMLPFVLDKIDGSFEPVVVQRQEESEQNDVVIIIGRK